MRIVVMGAGGVRGYFGARLAQAGHDVAFVARGRHRAAMRERGLTVESAPGDIRIAHPIGVLRADPELRSTLEAAMREGRAVGRAQGVALADDFIAQRMKFTDGQPAEMKSSMLNDLVAGNRLDTPWLSGAVARMAAEQGIPAPVDTTLYAALKPYCGGAPR